MKVFRKGKARILLAVIGLIGAGVLFILWPRKDALARWKADMRARGEKLSFVELAPPFRAECVAHEMRFNDLMQQGNFFRLRPGAIALMKKTGNGYARVVALQAEPVERGSAPTWEELAEQMETNAMTLSEMRRLIASWPEGSSRNHAAGINVGFLSLVQKRSAAYILLNALVNDLHHSAPTAALTNLQALLGLARLHEREGLLVDQMIRVAIGGLAVSATWEALQAPGWDDGALARLQTELAHTTMLTNMPRTVAMEQAFAMASYEEARTNARGPRGLVGSIGVSGDGRLAQWFNNAVYTPLWKKVWSRQDELIFLKAMRFAAEAVRQGQANRSYQSLNNVLVARRAELAAHHGSLDKFRYQVAEAAQVNWDKACLTLMRAETMRELAITAVALKRYQLKHSKLPNALEELVPDLMEKLTTDYMNGKTPCYRCEQNGEFSLHSVGENGRDENGRGDDIVWPKPEAAP